MTKDPIKDGTNWYQYVKADPVNRINLLGLCYESKTDLIKHEAHKFNQYTNKKYKDYFSYNKSEPWKNQRFRKSKQNNSWKKIHGKGQAREYEAFNFAKSKNKEAAYKSISMGMG